jgi:hypothetical protein
MKLRYELQDPVSIPAGPPKRLLYVRAGISYRTDADARLASLMGLKGFDCDYETAVDIPR